MVAAVPVQWLVGRQMDRWGMYARSRRLRLGNPMDVIPGWLAGWLAADPVRYAILCMYVAVILIELCVCKNVNELNLGNDARVSG